MGVRECYAKQKRQSSFFNIVCATHLICDLKKFCSVATKFLKSFHAPQKSRNSFNLTKRWWRSSKLLKQVLDHNQGNQNHRRHSSKWIGIESFWQWWIVIEMRGGKRRNVLFSPPILLLSMGLDFYSTSSFLCFKHVSML